AVQHAVGMVARNDHSALPWNPREVGQCHVCIDFQFSKSALNKWLGLIRASGLDAAVQSSQSCETEKRRHANTTSRRRSVDSAWRARCSRTLTAVGVIERSSATSLVETLSMSRRIKTSR